MKIEHLALYVEKLEEMKDFYQKYFGAKSGEKYHNPKKGFTSYFLSWDNGPRLELMHRGIIPEKELPTGAEHLGLTHFAIALGTEKAVDELTNQLRNEGFKVVGEPRWTGDGYYESVVLDPEGNRLELTV
ncbi:MAG: VOC family protein [Bacteroidia bacterium]|nr:VOC family protein [Bacteroidia bacterium]